MLINKDRYSKKDVYSQIVENFPPFNTLMSSQDVEKKMKKYLGSKEKKKEVSAPSFKINVVVEKTLPPNTALFIDHKKRIVAIFKDGTLVYSVINKMNELREGSGDV